jgi:hypothetical protein
MSLSKAFWFLGTLASVFSLPQAVRSRHELSINDTVDTATSSTNFTLYKPTFPPSKTQCLPNNAVEIGTFTAGRCVDTSDIAAMSVQQVSGSQCEVAIFFESTSCDPNTQTHRHAVPAGNGQTCIEFGNALGSGFGHSCSPGGCVTSVVWTCTEGC